MSNLSIEVSMGEAIDKLNILELKRIKISEPAKLIDIHKEIDALSVCIPTKTQYMFFYNLLTYVNEQIWDMTDVIKKTAITDPSFSYISNQIFEFNQKRFRLKTFFNVFTHSNLKEQKSYSSNTRYIQMNSIDTIYRKIAEMNYLSIEYDVLVFDREYQPILEPIFQQPNILYRDVQTQDDVILLDDFQLDSNVIPFFEFPTINYVCGGYLGDFIHSLSVVNEKFMETGQKARLFLSSGFGGDTFTYGLQNTYNDVYEIISKQDYIHDFLLHTNEKIDINLNDWRTSPLLYQKCYYDIYKQLYHVDFGKHRWLNVANDDKWKNTVFINVSQKRFTPNVDFKRIYDMYGDSLMFITNNVSDYEHFQTMTDISINCYHPTNFSDLCIAIHSCKLFIGNLSAPLSIGHALEKDRYMCLTSNVDMDNAHVIELPKYIKNLHFVDELYH